MIDELYEDDKEFLMYLLNNLPVSYLAMTYQDYMVLKKLKPKLKGKITNSDINRLELKLKLGEHKNFIFNSEM